MAGRSGVYDDFVFIRPCYPTAPIEELSVRLGISVRTAERYRERYKKERAQAEQKRQEERRRIWAACR